MGCVYPQLGREDTGGQARPAGAVMGSKNPQGLWEATLRGTGAGTPSPLGGCDHPAWTAPWTDGQLDHTAPG